MVQTGKQSSLIHAGLVGGFRAAFPEARVCFHEEDTPTGFRVGTGGFGFEVSLFERGGKGLDGAIGLASKKAALLGTTGGGTEGLKTCSFFGGVSTANAFLGGDGAARQGTNELVGGRQNGRTAG